ncbi:MULTISPECIES: DUF6194 family protein [Tsukamurella]|uniref:DUF6194 domain-containing protein n=2 Tax=Tsukamurella TaxID=2060 RepID=A0A5C5S282_9ACTN|nr:MULTISPECIES: DUF6194 family protein [Tsukamurella]NMD54959.1 hypothetical protein [Tsukamurella columbiensis]TWS29507.1 hypothetical protein FK530_08235 [Tsukamurella conjunctivitidis]
MTESSARDAVIALLQNLPDSSVETIEPGAVAADGTTPVPEIAWGDTFVYFAPGGAPGVMPYLTVITKDYPDDEQSDLGRPGAFRLNANVGREAFTELIGYPPAEHAARAGEWDYAADGALIPHPLYARLGWVSVVNPGTGPDVQAVIERAHRHVRNT